MHHFKSCHQVRYLAVISEKSPDLNEVRLFILLSYSQMEQICSTSSMVINHAMIILQTWNKMAHGVIM